MLKQLVFVDGLVEDQDQNGLLASDGVVAGVKVGDRQRRSGKLPLRGGGQGDTSGRGKTLLKGHGVVRGHGQGITGGLEDQALGIQPAPLPLNLGGQGKGNAFFQRLLQAGERHHGFGKREADQCGPLDVTLRRIAHQMRS